VSIFGGVVGVCFGEYLRERKKEAGK